MKKSNLDPQIVEAVFTMYKNAKYLREQHGLSTEEMAKIIEISEKKLIMAEACVETECFYDMHIKNICEYFQVTANDLFTKKIYEEL